MNLRGPSANLQVRPLDRPISSYLLHKARPLDQLSFSQPLHNPSITHVLSTNWSFLNPSIKHVISTEGGALCRRSGETPVFRLCCCRCPSLLFVIPQRSGGICGCPCRLPVLPPPTKPRHLDRSDSQPHREPRSGETPVFRLCCCRCPPFYLSSRNANGGTCCLPLPVPEINAGL